MYIYNIYIYIYYVVYLYIYIYNIIHMLSIYIYITILVWLIHYMTTFPAEYRTLSHVDCRLRIGWSHFHLTWVGPGEVALLFHGPGVLLCSSPGQLEAEDFHDFPLVISVTINRCFFDAPNGSKWLVFFGIWVLFFPHFWAMFSKTWIAQWMATWRISVSWSDRMVFLVCGPSHFIGIAMERSTHF